MSTPLKPGTLAQIIKSEMFPECVGWIVVVTRPALLTMALSASGMPCTRISHPPLGPLEATETDIPTAWLRPIRGDDEGEDETLQWAGKPSQQQHDEPEHA